MKNSLEMRRCFLQAAAATAAALPFIGACDRIRSESTPIPSRRRFFEDINNFNHDELGQLQDELIGFGRDFSQALAPLNFDREGWEQVAVRTAFKLGQIYSTYQNARKTGVYQPSDERKYQEDFYELGSALWAILRVGDVYKTDPQELKDNIALLTASNFVTNDDKTGDYLLGKELFSIHAKWTATSRFKKEIDGQDFVHLASPIAELLRRTPRKDPFNPKKPPVVASGLDRLMDWYFFDIPDKTGKDSLPDYTPDPDNPGRPAIVQILSQADDETRLRLIALLREKGLERIAPAIVSIDTDGQTRGKYVVESRTIELSNDTFDLGEFQASPQKYRDLIYHESIHALCYLLRALPESGSEGISKQELLLKLDHLLAKFRPYPDLTRLLKGDMFNGFFDSQKKPNHLNWLTLTAYAQGHIDNKYLLGGSFHQGIDPSRFPEEHVFDLMVRASESLGVQRVDSKYDYLSAAYPANALVYRHFHFEPDKKDEIIPSFKEFLEQVYDDSKGDTPLEKLVFAELQANLDLINNSTHPNNIYRYSNSDEINYFQWSGFFMRRVLPHLIYGLIETRPDDLEQALRSTMTRAQKGDVDRILHEIVLLGKGVHRAMRQADDELVADVLAGALRQDDQEIEVGDDLPEGALQEAKSLFSEIRDDLIGMGYAREFKSNQPRILI